MCRLTYQSFFDWYWIRKDEDGWSWKDPKTIFTMSDLKQCGIEVTAECGLLKATHTHQLPTDTITYNFAHLTIQEFLCSLYISQQEQHHLMSKYFNKHFHIFVWANRIGVQRNVPVCGFKFVSLF